MSRFAIDPISFFAGFIAASIFWWLASVKRVTSKPNPFRAAAMSRASLTGFLSGAVL